MKNMFLVLSALFAMQTVQAADITLINRSSDRTLERAASIFKKECKFLIGEASSINECKVVRASVGLAGPSSELVRKTLKQLVYRTHSGYVIRDVTATAISKTDRKISETLQGMIDNTIDLSYSENGEEILPSMERITGIGAIALGSDASELHQVSVVHDHGVANLLSFFNRKTNEFVLFSIISSE